jgi:lipoprotein-anchoring transpeptidase ErfK/SrfK
VWWTQWWAVTGVVVLVAGGVVAALVLPSSGPSAAQVAETKAKVASAQAAALAQAQAQMHARLVAQLTTAVTVSPAPGAAGVAPDAPVTVSTTTGTLSSVKVTDSAGTVLAGTVSSLGRKWQSTAALLPTNDYRVVATVAGTGGVSAQRVTTFSTLTPAYLVGATAFPSDGMDVGVGQPIVINFDHYVRTTAGQAAALSHITISMSKPVPGGWHWFSMDELHFRPKAYWPSGEKITVTANFDGWDAGLGRWGHGGLNQTFTIGDARISTANLATHQMTVTLNGAVVGNYPISAGSTVYPTMNGDHIVLDRQSVVHMVSSTVGIPVNSPAGYDEYVYNDVHISDSGEYVHDAPWSVGAQGSVNVSHGCINLSPTNSLTFFNFSRVGDVVQVIGGPRPPVYGDHGVMDWSTDWAQWTAATVHQLA